jgi:Ca-activated chloride channel family protein
MTRLHAVVIVLLRSVVRRRVDDERPRTTEASGNHGGNRRRRPSRRVRSLAVTCALGITLCTPTRGVGMLQDGLPRFTASPTELVVLPVTVSDARTGRAVTHLERDRFIIYDNGRRAEGSFFSNEDTPVTIGLIIDNSGSMRPKMPEVIAGILTFAHASNAADQLLTVAFNDTILDAGNRPLLSADTPAIESALRSMAPQGQTALYDALMEGMSRVEHGTNPRKALVVLSDGGDNVSRATLDEVLARARRSNIAIFTIGLFDPTDADRNPRVLKALAESTGGLRFLPQSPSGLLQACSQIAGELRTAYMIGFTPESKDGAFHRVRVEVIQDKGSKWSIRTRPGYLAAPP